MKLFLFVLLAIACFTKAAPDVALRGADEDSKDEFAEVVIEDGRPNQAGIGPRFLGDVTFNRDYNEEGEPPSGRQIAISMEHPVDDPSDETLAKPSEDEHDRRRLYYNCYSYCWWNDYYGWITYCCPWWGCGYYYC